MRHRVGPRGPTPPVRRPGYPAPALLGPVTHLVCSEEGWNRSGPGLPQRLPAGEAHLVHSATSTRTLCGLPATDFPFVFPHHEYLPVAGRPCATACREYTHARRAAP